MSISNTIDRGVSGGVIGVVILSLAVLCVPKNKIEKCLGEMFVTTEDVAAVFCNPEQEISTFEDDPALEALLKETQGRVLNELEKAGVDLDGAPIIPPENVIMCTTEGGLRRMGRRGMALTNLLRPMGIGGEGLYYRGIRYPDPTWMVIDASLEDPTDTVEHEFAHTLRRGKGFPDWLKESAAEVVSEEDPLEGSYPVEYVIWLALSSRMEEKGITEDGEAYLLRVVNSPDGEERVDKDLLNELLQDLEVPEYEKIKFVEIVLFSMPNELGRELGRFLKESGVPAVWIKFLIESEKEEMDGSQYAGIEYELTVMRHAFTEVGEEKSETQNCDSNTIIMLRSIAQYERMNTLVGLMRLDEQDVLREEAERMAYMPGKEKELKEIMHILGGGHLLAKYVVKPFAGLTAALFGLLQGLRWWSERKEVAKTA